MMSEILGFGEGIYNDKKLIELELRGLSWEMRLYGEEKEIYFKKKYPDIGYLDLVEKVRKSVGRKFGEREKKLLKDLLSASLFN